MSRSMLTIIGLAAIVMSGGSAAVLAACPGEPVGQDHPLVPRYEEACLVGAQDKTFDRFVVPLGPVSSQGGKWAPAKSEAVEGVHTTRIYAAPEGRSALEVFRNYEQGLASRGFAVEFQCAAKECSPSSQLLQQVLYPSPRRNELRSAGGGDKAYYAFNGSKAEYFLAARRRDTGAWLAVYVGTHGSLIKDLRDRAIVLAELIEPAAMETKLIDAGAMAKAISETGRVALRSILFDTGKSVIKPESAEVLNEIATLLKQQAALKLYVVGHTDSVGQHEANLALSKARAEAVVEALVTARGIARGRLMAAGVADLAPVASNATEAGRAENRRVELVGRP